MDVEDVEGHEHLSRTLAKRHLNVYDSCPVVIDERRGVLGISGGVYYRVWFDTPEESRTLFSSNRKGAALQRFEELKREFGR